MTGIMRVIMRCICCCWGSAVGRVVSFWEKYMLAA